MKIYYIANARMPNDKAHGIQIAKMCEAFIESGVDLTLVVSSRGLGDLEQSYGLSRNIPLRRVPVFDLQFLGPIGYRLTALQFIVGSFLYVCAKAILGERFVIYTIDMDQFSFTPLFLVPRPLFAEMHGIKRPNFLARYFFKHAGIIATNDLIAENLARTFSIPPERMCIEPNGVDESVLQNRISQQDARAKLNLPLNEPFALYVGRFYAWKGLEILADAAPHSPIPLYVVGGTREEYESVTKKSGERLHFCGMRPSNEIPLWMAAADVLLLLGTAKNEDSYRHTSPMKVFEYLAARRATIVSKTQAMESSMRDDTVFWYKPDDARSLAQVIREAYTSSDTEAKITAGLALAAEHTWRRRTERIMQFMGKMTQSKSSGITYALLAVGFAFVLFFSSFHLFNSPETWMDEGLITQSAVGLLHTGKSALPVAPGVYEPAWYITTGFPLTLPLAGAFAVFGVSLEVARLVMLLFLVCFYVALLLYARKSIYCTAAWFGFFFLVFFAPIYGDGRNVLGEIPGLLFIVLALLPLLKTGELTRTRALISGVGAGLAVATKPIFILFLPALLIACLLHYKELNLKKVFMFGVLGVLAPIMLWVVTQFDHASVLRVLSVYANPHEVNIGSTILLNVKRLFIEIKPLYFLGALVLWVASYVIRRFRHETISLVEEVLLFFSVLVLLAYLRTAGFYRYFLPAQVFALLYLPQSLLYFFTKQRWSLSRAAIIFLCVILLYQANETFFHSWTATHYDSARTASLEHYFSILPPGEAIFVYQAPEIVQFAGERPLYQFVQITPSIMAGSIYAPLLLSGKAPLGITSIDFFQSHKDDIFSKYMISEIVDNYVTLVHKSI